MPEMPPAAGGQQPQQPPFGSTQATAATPNKGYEAAGLQALGVIVKMMEPLLPKLGASSEAGQALLKAIQALSKFVPAGSVTPAGQKQVLDQSQMQNAQNNQQMQALKAKLQAAGGAQGGGQQQPMQGAA
jgi:hypothetical protein